MNTRKWFFSVIVVTVVCMAAGAAFVFWVDPFFHYHGPVENLEYPLVRDFERYQNDGILRHFSYDTIITGTSMTENFKTSEVDELFDATSVKVPFAGGLYKEINDNLTRAYSYGNEIKYVFRCLDYQCLAEDKDATKDIYDYAEYMTNENPFDDVNYLLNKSAMERALKVLIATAGGGQGLDFDSYANWMQYNTFGPETVLASYELADPAEEEKILDEEEETMIRENVRQNVVALAEEHPETTFYLYFPPYSIAYWDQICNDGELDWHIAAEQAAIEEMISCPNIKLYSFSIAEEIICDLDNYADYVHYAEDVNSWILECMQKDEYLLTEDNYQEYLEDERNFFSTYDYAAIHVGEQTTDGGAD
jgi:hypothetical protein